MRIINYADIFILEKSVEKKQIEDTGEGIEGTYQIVTSAYLWRGVVVGLKENFYFLLYIL